MKPLVLALSAACLALALAACGGDDGAKSAGPTPSVPVETAPPATSHGGTLAGAAWEDHFAQIVEYVARADAICETATDKLEAALAELPDPYGAAHAGLGMELSEEALVQLRALPPPEFGAVNHVALCSRRGGSQESASGPTRAEFIAQANEICRAANSRTSLETNYLEDESIVRIAEEALAQLRALPQPEADRALLEVGFYQVAEQEIYAYREAMAAHSAGDDARKELLVAERVHLTHQKHAFVGVYGLSGDCPVILGGA